MWNFGFNTGSALWLIAHRLQSQRRYPLARLLNQLRRLVSDPENRIRRFTQHGKMPRTRQNCRWTVHRNRHWISIAIQPL